MCEISMKTKYISGLARKLRTSLGMSQEKLAQKTKFSQSTISKFERGFCCNELVAVKIFSEIAKETNKQSKTLILHANDN